MNTHIENYLLQMISDKTTTQAPLHSRFARVGEYPFSSSSLHFLTRIGFANSTKLNIKLNSPSFLVGVEKQDGR